MLLLVERVHMEWATDGRAGYALLPQIVGRNCRVSFVCVMSLDTLLEAAKFLESSSKGTTKDDSAIARGMIE